MNKNNKILYRVTWLSHPENVEKVNKLYIHAFSPEAAIKIVSIKHGQRDYAATPEELWKS